MHVFVSFRRHSGMNRDVTFIYSVTTRSGASQISKRKRLRLRGPGRLGASFLAVMDNKSGLRMVPFTLPQQTLKQKRKGSIESIRILAISVRYLNPILASTRVSAALLTTVSCWFMQHRAGGRNRISGLPRQTSPIHDN